MSKKGPQLDVYRNAMGVAPRGQLPIGTLDCELSTRRLGVDLGAEEGIWILGRDRAAERREHNSGRRDLGSWKSDS
jgi:hypothetical protein